MQTAINNHHIEPIHTAYCGYSFCITRKKNVWKDKTTEI